MKCGNERRDGVFDIVIVGAGYRSISFLASHPELFDHDIALVEQSDLIGPGAFALFDELSTSDGRGFFRHVDPDGDFGWIYSDPSLAMLTTRNTAAPLPLVDDALRRVGSAIEAKIGNGACFRNMRIKAIKIGGPGPDVVLEVENGPAMRARFGILATGRSERPAPALKRWSSKTLLSSEVLSRSNATRIRAILARMRSGSIVIAGGSHSAFSVASKIKHWIGELKQEDVSYRGPDLVLTHRGKFRLHAPSVQHAEAEPLRSGAEKFDATRHVCSVTGVVFRDSGLRHSSRRLCIDILGGNAPQISHRECLDLKEAANLFDSADLIIQALGYRGRYPTIISAKSGQPLVRGPLRTDRAGMVLRDDGKTIPNLAAIRVEPTPKSLKDSGAYGGGLYADLASKVSNYLLSSKKQLPNTSERRNQWT